MIPVIGRVEILAIPARRKHELYSDSVGAIGIEISLVREIVAVKGAFRVPAVVETVEADGALLKINLAGLAERDPERLFRISLLDIEPSNGVVTAETVSSDHAEAFRESLDPCARVVVVLEEEVVRKHSADLLNKLVGAIGVLEVEGRCPIHRFVLGNAARGAVCVQQILERCLFTETCPPGPLSAWRVSTEAANLPEEP